MLNLLQRRRSIRKFTDHAVAPEAVEKILRAALFCPTSMGRQSVELVTVTQAGVIAQLMECKQHGSLPLQTATLAIVVVADSTKIDVWTEDAAIAAFAMQLQAEELGLGSTWVQMRRRLSVRGEDSEAAVRAVLGLPEHYGVLCVLAVGHKGEEKPAYTEADLKWERVHREKF